MPIRQNPKWVFLIFLFFFFFFSPFLSDPRPVLLCGSSNRGTISDFLPNFIVVMDNLTEEVDESGWSAVSILSPAPQIYTFAQCFSFLSHNDCIACQTEGRTELPRCFPADSGRIYLDGCYLRYDTHEFFEEPLNRNLDTVKCGRAGAVTSDQYVGLEFAKRVYKAVQDVTTTAAMNNGFALAGEKGGVEAVYAVAQCWKKLTPDSCRKCLTNAALKVSMCAPASEGTAMNVGCYLRYSTENFSRNVTELPKESASPGATIVGVTIVGILAAIILTMLALICGVHKRVSERKTEKKNLADISISVDKSLNFKYELLEKATNSFDGSRKLGQGGAGSVFKGTLHDGTIVAVKRLFFNTRQWADEFFNGVNLISRIQHKNIVKLLGCSIEGPESLLVYEYVINKSLDQIIFGKNNTILLLTWQKRFDIISGVAAGLAYLHGGCGEKIIHRDIKTSNILLDENLTAKIADFGLARCVAPDKSHISTGVAGTLGYMAPEYLVRGQLTEKADVYAFGVLALEVVCGNCFHDRIKFSFALSWCPGFHCCHQVWRNYKAKKITDSVDPALNGVYSVGEASNVLQIGLLCTQASAALRPSMFEVVEMLNNEKCVIPPPKQPPFLNASVLSSDDSSNNSYSTITLTSNWKTTTEGFSLSNSKSSISSGQPPAEATTFYSAQSASVGIPGSDN